MRKITLVLMFILLFLLNGCADQGEVIIPDNCDETIELLKLSEDSIEELEDEATALNEEIALLLNAQKAREDLRDALWIELFPTATEFRKVTRNYVAHHDIVNMYEVYKDTEYLGNLYHISAIGASAAEVTFIEFFLGIKEDNTFAGFKMWDENETETKADPFYLTEYGNSYSGDNIETEFTIDDVAGSSITNAALQKATLEIATYHVEIYLGREYARPTSLEATEANLLLAFPDGVTFNSVYMDYLYNENINNIYQVLDVSNVVLGYVYYGNSEGRGGTIEFTWGIDLTDTTVLIEILNDTETWDLSYNFGIYNGSVGYWPNTSWLTNFEDVTLTTIIDPGIDSVAGVSVTTGNFSDALKIIAQYHIDQLVGKD